MISDKLISVDKLRQYPPESCWLVGPFGVGRQLPFTVLLGQVVKLICVIPW